LGTVVAVTKMPPMMAAGAEKRGTGDYLFLFH
jgi:hypothetical protein